MIVQLCGLSGVGKTTLAKGVQKKLRDHNIDAAVIDGDDYRKTLCKDLGFSKADRYENIRRLGAVANDFSLQGVVAIISAINPYEIIRQELIQKYKNVKLVHLDCFLNTLIERDTKGLYQKALLPEGHPKKINNLTGINDQFEIPANPNLYIHTDTTNIEQSIDQLLHFILKERRSIHNDLPVHRFFKQPA